MDCDNQQKFLYLREGRGATVSFLSEPKKITDENKAEVYIGDYGYAGTFWTSTCVSVFFMVDEDRFFVSPNFFSMWSGEV
jgi:hypothetical protein